MNTNVQNVDNFIFFMENYPAYLIIPINTVRLVRIL